MSGVCRDGVGFILRVDSTGADKALIHLARVICDRSWQGATFQSKSSRDIFVQDSAIVGDHHVRRVQEATPGGGGSRCRSLTGGARGSCSRTGTCGDVLSRVDVEGPAIASNQNVRTGGTSVPGCQSSDKGTFRRDTPAIDCDNLIASSQAVADQRPSDASHNQAILIR
jgi:hypothetical protein